MLEELLGGTWEDQTLELLLGHLPTGLMLVGQEELLAVGPLVGLSLEGPPSTFHGWYRRAWMLPW